MNVLDNLLLHLNMWVHPLGQSWDVKHNFFAVCCRRVMTSAAFPWCSHTVKIPKEPCFSTVKWNLSLWPPMSIIYIYLNYNRHLLSEFKFEIHKKTPVIVRTISMYLCTLIFSLYILISDTCWNTNALIPWFKYSSYYMPLY